MNPIEFISAGAGSGKTYRLTQVLTEVLSTGLARPQAIMATTFTVKAAEELRQRARKQLLDAGRLDLATAIGQARIGTVNSVCGQLLKRYCFEIGLSPDQTVLSESQAIQLLRTSVELVLDDERREELAVLSGRFSLESGEWEGPVKKVMDAARSNGIESGRLRGMGKENAKLLLAHWPQPDIRDDFTQQLKNALQTAITGLAAEIAQAEDAGSKVQQNTRDALAEALSLAISFDEGTWTWSSWLAAAALNPGVKLKSHVQPVVDVALAHERHPQFHADVNRYLELVFDVAADALDQYSISKRETGAVDFIDQETLILRALQESQTVRESIASELDLVLVDEFQDTNPLQLALFVELAKLAKRSVWVGDPKQAIYGFRGTDAALIAAILGAIEDWGGTVGETLSTSRRSVPQLVNLANAIFVPAFAAEFPANGVELAQHREGVADQPTLMQWTFESPKTECDYLGVGQAIADLLASGAKIGDRETKMSRAVQPGDIAILCRKNDQVILACDSLARWGVPAAGTRPGLLATPEASLVLACLRRIFDATDTLATALVVSLSDSVEPGEWLEDRLAFMKSGVAAHRWKLEGDGAHPLLRRLEVLRPRLLSLTPAEALRLAKAESHVALKACQWSVNPEQARIRFANIEALSSMAQSYENECVSARRPATVGGLIRWFSEQATLGKDLCAAAVGGAVEVLTHHRSKGLEWPIVVMTGLGESFKSSLWDVRARTNGAFNPVEPIANRFVHFWPKLYGKRKLPQSALNAEGSEIGVAMQTQARDENKRLLYVSFTRARDILVLATTTRRKPTAWLDEIDATKFLVGESKDVDIGAGLSVRRLSTNWTAEEIAVQPPTTEKAARWWFQTSDAVDRTILWLRPSEVADGNFETAVVESVGKRIAIRVTVDMAALGSAIHLCIASAFATPEKPVDMGLIEAVLQRWKVDAAVDAEAVMSQVAAVMIWVAAKWPGARVLAEVPIEVEVAEGRHLRGQIDMLVEVAAGWVLIDHKADPRSAAGDSDIAQRHGPQLAAYADGVFRATGRHVVERWLFLPVAGQAVRVEASANAQTLG